MWSLLKAMTLSSTRARLPARLSSGGRILYHARVSGKQTVQLEKALKHALNKYRQAEYRQAEPQTTWILMEFGVHVSNCHRCFKSVLHPDLRPQNPPLSQAGAKKVFSSCCLIPCGENQHLLTATDPKQQLSSMPNKSTNKLIRQKLGPDGPESVYGKGDEKHGERWQPSSCFLACWLL